jgi:hypothetical protein
MPTFTKWEWQGDEKHQTLVGIDTMGEGLATYHQLAEARSDNDGDWWGMVYVPQFAMVQMTTDEDGYPAAYGVEELSTVQRNIEDYLHEQGVI